MKRTSILGMSFLLAAAVALPAFPQTAKTRAEYDAYVAFYQEKDPKKQAELGEKFLTDYKDSEFKTNTFVVLSNAYSRGQNHTSAMEVADRFTTEAPTAAANAKVGVYSRAMAAAEAASKADKVVEYGELVLKTDPANLETLITVSRTLSELQITDEAKKAETLTKALSYATQAKDGASKLFGGAKPAQVSDSQWKEAQNSFEGSIYSTLGMIHLNRNEYGHAVANYDESLKRSPKDDVAYFRMGLAYNSMNRDLFRKLEEAVKAENDAKVAKAEKPVLDELVAKREAVQNDVKANQDKAIDSLAKAVALSGPASQPARQQLERLYKAKNNDSLDGLEDLIQKAKASIG